ncbi:hypothetical protein EVAR_71547_1 [Eumeta japonica]|uniref:Uncharacterized protein n=1 Tax=Eumeta variegata TaxID=151549 RepID=A0A4C1T084_EUMVA|nr:hypothetical protein EVAR_71547_1 [Eumeta japonica]
MVQMYFLWLMGTRKLHRMGLAKRLHFSIALARDKRACEPPESRWSSPPMDTPNRRGVTRAFSGLLGENRIFDRGGNRPSELVLAERNA